MIHMRVLLHYNRLHNVTKRYILICFISCVQFFMVAIVYRTMVPFHVKLLLNADWEENQGIHKCDTK